MAEQAGSVAALLAIVMLSDYRVLNVAWGKPFAEPMSWSEWRIQAYLAYQPWAARYPDHVFDMAWRSLEQNQSSSASWLSEALRTIATEYLDVSHGNIHVKREVFGAWQQSVCSRTSTIAIHSSAIVEFGRSRYLMSSQPKLALSSRQRGGWSAQTLPLLRPYEPIIEDYVMREGIHEAHLHLNGSTHADVCWLRAIRSPKTETEDFLKAWKGVKNKSTVQELVSQVNPFLTPVLFHEHLRAARTLREWLVAAAFDQIKGSDRPPLDCSSLNVPDATSAPEPLDKTFVLNQSSTVHDELRWHLKLLERLRDKPSVQLERMLHCYLLLQNEYCRLNVQQETQYGFDQFQKFTFTELREPAEKSYLHRYLSMHGEYSLVSKTGYLEGRFAPKVDLEKTKTLLLGALGGYWQYLCKVTASDPQGGTPKTLSAVLDRLDDFFRTSNHQHRAFHRLALVAHFIKLPWSPVPAQRAGPYRHYALEGNLKNAAGMLLTALHKWPKLRSWIRGVDGAANELHAPPEQFAPIFRVCQRAGLTHRSFHAGEDFPHLLSGIRYIWDSLLLLNLRDCDRIGHATAMGIKPSLWLERMPGAINIFQGDWLLSVLCAWQLLREEPDMQGPVERLHRELEKVANDIFGRWMGATEVERVMALRNLSSSEVFKYLDAEEGHGTSEESINDYWREEAELVRAAGLTQRKDLEQLKRWLGDEKVLANAFQLVNKQANFLDAPTCVRLQQALMTKVAARGVLIETLPSSNVRISQYQLFSEHHALRWMRVPGHIQDGDPEIMICLGSDDPGIFAGDLETEFHQLYAAMLNEGLSDEDALHRLSIVNERGRKYRFHSPSLS